MSAQSAPRRAPAADAAWAERRAQVHDALARLHDPTALERHPLSRLIVAAGAGSARRVSPGQALRRDLLEAVAALRGEAHGPDGRSPREHRLLTLRYVEGWPIADVRRELTVSRSEYFREHQRALEAVAALLGHRWGRLAAVDTAPPLAPIAPRPAIAGRPRAQLPIALTSFVGREQELREVRRLLADARLLTLVGPPGAGKTRLALESVAEPGDLARDGLWLVELAGLSDGALLQATIGAAVGAPADADPTAGLVRWLGARRALLVLDNCEHLVEAIAGQIGALLRACAGVRVLATSREPLGVPGEVVWPVPPLAADEGLRLFADRARAARPSFTPSADDRDAIARVCSHLDGLPLAIELAAARVRALSATEVANRLGDALGLLSAGSRAAPARHQTLRAAVDWSHRLLGHDERRLFRSLGTFAGSFDLAAAEDVAGATVDLLARLVDRSLVGADPDRAGGTRYRLLEPIRQYAVEQLVAADEMKERRARHFACYLALAERLEPGLWGEDERRGGERLELEHDNLRSALGWALEAAPAGALRLAANLWRYWWLRGYRDEGRHWLGAALACAPSDAPERAYALVGAAHLARDGLDYAAMCPLAEEGLTLAEARGDHRAAGLAQNNVFAMLIGRSAAGYRLPATLADEVEALAGRALAHYRAADFGWGVASATNLLARAASARGDFAGARVRHQEAVEAARRNGSRQNIAVALGYLGSLAYETGDVEQADRLLDEAESVAQDIRHWYGAPFPWFWVLRGQVKLARGDVVRAEETFRVGVERAASAWAIQPPITVYWLGVAKVRRGDVERGVRLMGAAHHALASDSILGVGTLDQVQDAVPTERFRALWAEGEAMTPEEAVIYALGR